MRNTYQIARDLYTEAVKGIYPKKGLCIIGGDMETAKLLSDALLYNPTDTDAAREIAKLFRVIGNAHGYEMYMQRAGIYYEKEVVTGDAKLINDRAMEHYRKSQVLLISEFSRALLIDPACKYAYINLSYFFTINNCYEPALEYAKLAILHDPKSVSVWEHYWSIVNRAWRHIDDEVLASKVLSRYTNYFEARYIDDRKEIMPLDENSILVRVMPELEFIESLQNEGEMLFKPSRVFRDSDTNDPRTDVDENKQDKYEILPSDKVIRIENQLWQKEIGGMNFSIDARGSAVEIAGMQLAIGGQENIYCFSAFTKANNKEFICNYQWDSLGRHAVVIKDVHEFKKRLLEAFKASKQDVESGHVTYIPDEQMKNVRAVFKPYMKKISYENEFEFRFSYSGSRISNLVTIGSLSDISEIVKVEELKELLLAEASVRFV